MIDRDGAQRPAMQTWEKTLWTRLQNAAAADNLTFEQMAQLSDYEIGRTPNLGRKSLALFRSVYPRRPPLPLPTGVDRRALVERLERIIAEASAALAALKADDEA